MIDLPSHLGAVASVEPVQGFFGNETFRVRTTAGETYYYKSGPGMSAEAQACALATRAGVPAPQVVAGTPEYLIQRAVPGAPVDAANFMVLTSLGQALAKLHQLQGDGFGLLSADRHPTWTAWLTTQVTSLHSLVNAGLLPETHRARLVDLVATSTREPDSPVLLHGDLHPRHVYTSNNTLTGIIDWGDALYGDPLFDLARFSIAGPEPTTPVLTAYGLDLTPELQRTFALYRAVWSAMVCRVELEAGGDWFQAHLDRIAHDLTTLN
ncbi:aminoglycoside phosphotransferase family protein [Kribbella italica]|uniref:Aminoglycoside phosphotransferase (APT) family kinase protein n=1 Tax=Kribbella italica TaxID=1540520 RepID=A0A7W9J401_9ACTN|nr:aminoglycoside phosphotransferase family protein [Kribbella italica]MBB5835206.1 aminoglycoside phosphotransferase (APT) family kinase protein [Kribbella italica]